MAGANVSDTFAGRSRRHAVGMGWCSMSFERRPESDPCYRHRPDPPVTSGVLLLLLILGALALAHEWLNSVAAVLLAACGLSAVTYAAWWWAGELRAERRDRRECRLSHRDEAIRQEARQAQRALPAPPARRALPAPTLPPLRPGAFVIDDQRSEH